MTTNIVQAVIECSMQYNYCSEREREREGGGGGR
jgi:hypothetical protein